MLNSFGVQSVQRKAPSFSLPLTLLLSLNDDSDSSVLRVINFDCIYKKGDCALFVFSHPDVLVPQPKGSHYSLWKSS